MKIQPILRAMTLLAMALALAAGLWGVMPVQVARTAGQIYYSQGSLAPNLIASWNTNRTGGGLSPTNFTDGDSFVIQNEHNMTTADAWTVSGTGASIQIENGGILTANHLVSVPTFRINHGGTYNHNVASGTLPGSSTRDFFSTSTVVIMNWAGTGAAFPNNTIFGNLTINIVSYSSSISASVPEGNTMVVNGNFVLQATGGGDYEFRISNNHNTTLQVGGDFEIAGGRFDFTNSSTAGNVYTLTVGGDINFSSGIWDQNNGILTVNYTGGNQSVTSTHSGTFNSTTLNRINWAVASGKTVQLDTNHQVGTARTFTVNGTIDCGANAVTGVGNFTLASGATLGVGSSDGISAGTSTGNIRVSGTRTFDTGANYVFNGTAAQVTGDGFPSTINNLMIDNTFGVALSSAATANGVLALNAGQLKLGSSNLTLGSGATVSGSPNPNVDRMVVIDGNGALCKAYGLTTGSFTFPVGETTDIAEYSPATISFNSIGDPGVACVRVIDAVHNPNPSTTDYLSRYWDINAVDSFGKFEAALTFTYQDSDVASGMNEGNMYGLRYDAAAAGQKWTRFPLVNAAGNTFQATVTGFSDYTAGDYNPTAITLASLTATPQDKAVLVTWETASELDNVGFNLYRSATAAGPYTQLNDTLIPPQFPGKVMGGDYEWLDTDVQPGIVYFYKLEDLDVKGVSTFHGPVSTSVVTTPTAVGLRSVSARGVTPSLTLGLMMVLGLAIVFSRYRRHVIR